MKVELLRAWPRRFERVEVELPEGASVAEALSKAGWSGGPETVACAVFGVTVTLQTALANGDRIELLRPLQADPKDARRRRAEARRGGK
ncbi:putative ubiquitin-RnfH superfamily antitoxin RatB of RatAB toxin-antitoxin module [Lysobacter niastensis]|uniref:UPF0125 protein J2X06_001754 n=1 Tax=Lysobacter niastensis TaxID=380629 RepID=A0ABU1WAD9_9GAMM|nr:RnfH family protein [Lysobacter niastensis]MDR7134570.1 putative ubiquitin-RnfH superfamily antitoxin RatB of RatAB toxin-antitoxin module [Lysobacter niastensis]